jgi:CbiX
MRRRASSNRQLVKTAHMELAAPSLADTIAECAQLGVSRVIVAPFFLSRRVIPLLPSIFLVSGWPADVAARSYGGVEIFISSTWCAGAGTSARTSLPWSGQRQQSIQSWSVSSPSPWVSCMPECALCLHMCRSAVFDVLVLTAVQAQTSCWHN